MTHHPYISLPLLAVVLPLSAQTIDLSGLWQFQTDPSGLGEANGWHRPALTLADTITLPGSMPQRLKGDAVSIHTQWTSAIYDSSYYHNPFMAPYRHSGDSLKLPFFLTPSRHYVGRAWYKRTIQLTQRDGTDYTLFIERPHIATQVWVNGQRVHTTDTLPSAPTDTRNSLCVPHTYDLSPYLTTGSNTLAIMVDNSPAVANVGQDSHSITDQTQGNWNGLTGRLELQRHTVIRHLRTTPDVDAHRLAVDLQLHGLRDEAVTLTLTAQSFNTARRHIVVSQPLKTTLAADRDTLLSLTLDMGRDMLTWDEFCPQMYYLTLEARTPTATYTADTYFGMRKLEVRGRTFYVNNRPTQLRGSLDNCLFPNTGYPPTDVDSWLRIFERYKEWGLNHVRFHSYCPPEAAFLAADLTGIYVQAESPSWPNHGVRLGDGQYVDTYLYDEARRISLAYGNHPSFAFFAFGNEPAGRGWVPWTTRHTQLMHHYDPRRLYCGFSVGGGWAWQPGTEYAVKAGARGLDSWRHHAPEATEDYREKITTYNGRDMPGTPITIPFVSHETGQWCAFPNLAEATKYTGVNKAYNLHIFRDLLEANNMSSRAHAFHMASGQLQLLCYKAELERTLRTPSYAGFQLLGLSDYSGQGSAIVGLTDAFYDDKAYVNAPTFRQFCSPIVPLARIPKFTYTTDETFRADILLSQYSADTLRDVTPHWEVRATDTHRLDVPTLAASDDDAPLAQGDLATRSFPIGQHYDLGTLSVPLSTITQAGKYTLTVTLPGTDARNQWHFWVYPAAADTVSTPAVKAIRGTSAHYEADGILVTDTLDRRALRELRRGGRVLLLAAGKVQYGREVKQQFTPVFWNTSWFKMRPPHTLGLLIDNDHPVFQLFPTDYHSDTQWWELVTDAQVMQFTDFPRDFQPLVQSIDTWFVSRKIGMLFEARVLGGRLIMTTFDLTTDLSQRHAARQLRHSILSYMSSPLFHPQHVVDVPRISDLFTKVAGEVNMYTNDSPDELKPKLK